MTGEHSFVKILVIKQKAEFVIIETVTNEYLFPMGDLLQRFSTEFKAMVKMVLVNQSNAYNFGTEEIEC